MSDGDHINPDASDEVWASFFCVEMSDGRTFDPIKFLAAVRDYGTVEIGGIPTPWEKYYAQDPAFLAADLTHAVSNGVREEREVIVESIFRIAETLPVQVYNGQDTYGSKNDALVRLFWVALQQDDLPLMIRAYKAGLYTFSQEGRYYMEQALENPEAFKDKQ